MSRQTESYRLKALYNEIDVAKQTEIECILIINFFNRWPRFIFIIKPETDKSKIHWLFKRFDPYFVHEKDL